MKTDSYPPLRLAWFIWSLGALFYLMGFFQRVAPAVMTQELMQDFGIGAAALGNLSALYFYSYVAMQIPTGVLADRLGPRRLLSLGALIAGIGTVLFALDQDILLTDGFLSSASHLSAGKVSPENLYKHWLAPEKKEDIIRFQGHHGFKVDGLVGRQTLAALNVSARERRQTVLLNLERLRWLTCDLQKGYHLLVNIADFALKAYEDQEYVFSLKVIVGKKYHKTPVFRKEFDLCG